MHDRGNRGSTPVMWNGFLFSRKHEDGLWGPKIPPIRWILADNFLVVRRPSREADS